MMAGGHPAHIGPADMGGAAGGPARHRPVLLEEAMRHLRPSAGGLFIDATFGAGGYSRAILEAGGQVLAVVEPIAERVLSLRDGGLVIGTSNKTEILLGYSTQFGDAASAINPLGDLYKTQLRQLAQSMNIPAPIVDKPPSADLWEDQTDEGELGFTYEEVDKLLYLLIDQRYSAQECIEEGFDEKFVNTVIARIRRNQFKRMQPPVAKLSNRTIGYDFLYLRDWGT